MTEETTQPKIAICAPCHIPPTEAWIHSLKAEADAHGAVVVIVDDSDGNLGALPEEWKVFGYEAQKEFLGELYEDFARMFHKSSACRVFGHLWAYENKFDVIIGLDSDCIVKTNFIRNHTFLLGKDYGCGWFNPTGYPVYPRGFPYSKRQWEIVGNMGLWENVLDINGKDRQENEPKSVHIPGQTVPTGFFPFCGMNIALTRSSVLGFLFVPNFDHEDDHFRRIDDIWGGYIFQKMLQVKRKSVALGHPIVFHDTILDVEKDAEEEKGMYDHEDAFIETVDECFAQMIISDPNASYHDLFVGLTHAWENDSFNPLYQMRDSLYWWASALDKFEDK